MDHKIITFIGMDGSGKTTITKRLKEILEKKGLKVEIIYGGRGRNNILPIQFLGKLYKNAGGKDSNVPDGKLNKMEDFEKTSFIYTISAPLFALDLILRHFFIVIPKRNKNDFIITDRYTTDILLMNKVPMGFKKFLYFFMPKPEKIFYLYNDLTELKRRKPEHSIEDLKRQKRLFDDINKSLKPIKIKTITMNESVDKVINYIEKSY